MSLRSSVPVWRENAPAGVPLSRLQPARGTAPRGRAARAVTVGGWSAGVQASAFAGYLECLRPSDDRTSMVPAALTTLRAGTSGYDRVRVAALARALYDNGGLPGYAVNQIALYSAQVWPQSAATDKVWARQAERWFNDWSSRCDFIGRPEVDLGAIETQVCQAIDLDGDIGVALVGDAGFPQIQLVEGWRIGSQLVAAADKSVIDGVKVDEKGRVVGYLVDVAGKPVLVPSSEMLLVRDPSIVSPLRGISALRRGMNDIRDMRDILGFEKTAVKLHASMPGVMEGGFIDDAPNFDLSGGERPSQIDAPAEGEEATAGEKGVSRADLTGGDIIALPDGKTFKPIESNRPGPQFSEFMNQLVAQFVAGLDIPPAFFLDEKLTGSNNRSVGVKAQRKFDQRQEVMCRLVEWLWVRVIGWAIDNGELPATEDWQRIRFQCPAKHSIDAGRDAQNDRDDNAKGLKSRSRIHANRGDDWETETDQCFAEEDYILDKANEQSKRTGVPVLLILARWGYGNPNSSLPATATDASGQDPQTV